MILKKLCISNVTMWLLKDVGIDLIKDKFRISVVLKLFQSGENIQTPFVNVSFTTLRKYAALGCMKAKAEILSEGLD